MLVVLHVILALSSVAYSSFLLIAPSKTRFYATYGLVGGTLATGTYLTISTHTPILKACLTGLVYISVIVVLVVAAQRRFAATKIDKLQ